MSLLLCYGTQTGTTEALALDLHHRLEADAHTAEVHDLADVWPELLAEHRTLVLLTSTWIEGRMPNSAAEFYDQLVLLQPDLAHLRFALVAVGDRAYEPHLNHAAWRFRDTLVACGATFVAPPLAFEGGPISVDHDVAHAWLLQVLPDLFSHADDT